MPIVLNNFVFILFADDATILFEGNTINSIVTLLNYEFGKSINWLNANKLSIHVSRTHYMVLHRGRRNIYHKYIILNNNILQQVHGTKSVGIIIDNKWANHISYIKNKLAKCMDILLKARQVFLHTSGTAVISFFRFSISYLLLQSMGYCHRSMLQVNLIMIKPSMGRNIYYFINVSFYNQ